MVEEISLAGSPAAGNSLEKRFTGAKGSNKLLYFSES